MYSISYDNRPCTMEQGWCPCSRTKRSHISNVPKSQSTRLFWTFRTIYRSPSLHNWCNSFYEPVSLHQTIVLWLSTKANWLYRCWWRSFATKTVTDINLAIHYNQNFQVFQAFSKQTWRFSTQRWYISATDFITWWYLSQWLKTYTQSLTYLWFKLPVYNSFFL